MPHLTMEFDFPGIVAPFLAPAAVAAVTSFIFQTLARGKVDYYFNQKLEQFKYDLGKLAASAQFDYQRKLRDVQAFSSKRHEAYAGIFEGAQLVCHTLDREFSQFEFDVMCIRNEALYLSDNVTEATRKLISQCYHLMAKTRTDTLPRDAYLALLDGLKKGMSADLRIGDYDVPLEQRRLEAKQKEMDRLF